MNLPTVIPDYGSEKNWDAILALLPPESQSEALPYTQMRKRIAYQEAAFRSFGVPFQRIYINASSWKAWVEKNGHPFIHASLGLYATEKAVHKNREIGGLN